MALVFEHILTEGVAELSYLIGDDQAGVAALIDPRIDVDCYLELARKKKVSITHIFETHNHADLISGARELCERLGSAKIFLSHAGDTRYGYKHEALNDGDTFEFGSVILTTKHTPGHTTEHVSFLLSDKSQEKSKEQNPWGVLTGDSLFVNSAGRPDLGGSSQTDKLAEMLFDTLNNFYKKLDDSVIIYPAHGKGSPCGADIGDRLTSTIGYEKRYNPFLQYSEKAPFVKFATETAPPEPKYYKRTKQENAKGPEIIGHLPVVPGLPAKVFKEAVGETKHILIDTRSMLAFGGGHIDGALNLGAQPELSVWAGWMLEQEQKILLVLDSDEDLEKVVRMFWRTGFREYAGYLVGGMTSWDNAGFEIVQTPQITAREVDKLGRDIQIIDVRSPDEWKKGHVPNAKHIFLPELEKRINEIEKNIPKVTYCATGYRASLAASLLKRAGMENVFNLPGSFTAWKNAQLPIVKDKEDTKEAQK